MPNRRLKRWLISALALTALLFAAYACRALILTAFAQAWIINDPLQKADAIVVMGGGLQTRPFEAAKLYREGWAPKVLILNVKPSRTDELGITPPEVESTRKILESEQVPKSAIVAVGHDVHATWDDVAAVRDWAATNNCKRVILVTTPFHTRRVNFTARHLLRKADIQFSLTPATHLNCGSTNWWSERDDLLEFYDELGKAVFYHCARVASQHCSTANCGWACLN